MSWTEKNLMKDEKIVNQTRLHWFIFIRGIYFLFVSALLLLLDSGYIDFMHFAGYWISRHDCANIRIEGCASCFCNDLQSIGKIASFYKLKSANTFQKLFTRRG